MAYIETFNLLIKILPFIGAGLLCGLAVALLEKLFDWIEKDFLK